MAIADSARDFNRMADYGKAFHRRGKQIRLCVCLIRQYPDKVIARLVTDAPSPYLLLAGTLAEIHAALPPHLMRSDRQPADPPEVVEVWFAA